MAIQARLETLETTPRRASPRRKLRLGSTIGAGDQDVMIRDLSATGVLIQTSAKLEPFDDLEVDLPEVGATQAFLVWHSGEYFGCEFARPIPRAAISAALLRNPIPSPPGSENEGTDTLELEDEAPTDRLSFATRMRAIVGTSLAFWVVILWAVGLI
jgi:hypothetical protein